jgi:hypothetical protein
MAKTKVSEWSATPANNTDVGGIDINEGCAPSGINNAIRDMMSQIKDMQTGADGDNFVVGGNLSVTGTTTLSGAVSASGTFNGTVGATTPNTGAFTTLSTSGNTTIGDASADTLTVNATPTFNVAIPVASGGTGRAALTSNNVVLGNGTSAVNFVAPSTSGNVLTSNGTTWTSAPAAIGITTTTGSAPYYGARAWVNFDGTGANGSKTIRASANVSSVVKNSTGDYTINFTTAMPDANYCATGSAQQASGRAILSVHPTTFNTTSLTIRTFDQIAAYDSAIISVSIFR